MDLAADFIDDDPHENCLVGVGDVIAGKYEVERVIGEGGMGVVVSAMHVELQERVAIKLMLPSLVGHTESATRFAREARATVRIKSEHVARLFDFGKLPDGSPFMVMEYLEGETLAQQLNRTTSIELSRAIDIVIEACAGVADAHRLDIIHRDLKPENLFLARTGDDRVVVKVLDFGISKANLKNLSPTRTEGGMGTPAYAAPEQLRCAGDAGPEADVWSLGVVLFELLTGRLPFQAGSFAEMCAAVLTQRAPHPCEIRPEIDESLDAVVMRCLEVEPAQRYSSVIQLAVALGPYASETGHAIIARLDPRGSRTNEGPSGPRMPIDALLGTTGSHQQALTEGDPVSPRSPKPSLSGRERESGWPVATSARPGLARLGTPRARRASLLAAAAVALFILGGAFVSDDAEVDVAAVAAASTIEGKPVRSSGPLTARPEADAEGSDAGTPPPTSTPPAPAPPPPPSSSPPLEPPPPPKPPAPRASAEWPPKPTPATSAGAAAAFNGFGGRK